MGGANLHFAWDDDSATVTVTIPPPDADFDSDGDIDGRGFLAWQRGYGIQAPNATKADGDADNDLDVGGDDLGILGGRGVYAANIWGGGSYIDGAFDMYLDYDGAGSTFGDTSIDADTSNIANSAVYASVDSSDPNRMVVVAINRTGKPKTTGIAVTHDRIFDRAEVYQLTSASWKAQAVADIELDLLNAFQYTMPAYSVTTLVLISDGIVGDFNRNGTVDAADYTIWRDSLGQVGNTAADANEDNIVDLDDYNLWKNNFGVTLSGSGSSATPVPEPAGIIVVVVTCLLATTMRRSPLTCTRPDV